MPNILTAVLILSLAPISMAHEFDLPLGAEDELIVEGPIEVHLVYSPNYSLSFDKQRVQVNRDGRRVTIVSEQPTVINLEVPNLKSLAVTDGQLMILLEGNERLRLQRLDAPEIRVRLNDRARLTAESMLTEHLQILLSDQGKASIDFVKANLLELTMQDHGDVAIAGQATAQAIELSDFAHYDGKALKSEDVTVVLHDYSAGSIQVRNRPIVEASPFTSLSALSAR